ncbi:hypothetical protein [Pseudarthrobacter oxydans]|uniref:hypothetical protein n=1 Tax=Pseudarthrobacter oxydans TaxID=1671 RepID=UPI00343589A3
MNTSCNALVVPARLAHPVHIRPLDLDATALQRVAAGDVGYIAGHGWRAYLNNDGSRSFPNLRAEVLIREAGVELEDSIHGTAFLLGYVDPGEVTDAPRRLISLAEQLFDVPLAA